MEEGRHENRKVNRNSEAKFASPENNTGIGYYDSEGNRLSPAEFEALVSRNAARLRDEEDDG